MIGKLFNASLENLLKKEVYRLSQGIPRKTLKICDWAVLEAIRQDLDTIDISILKKGKSRTSREKIQE